jgi:hypothetical protein
MDIVEYEDINAVMQYWDEFEDGENYFTTLEEAESKLKQLTMGGN